VSCIGLISISERTRRSAARRATYMDSLSLSLGFAAGVRQACAIADDRPKGSKYVWLTSFKHHSEKQHARLQSLCNLTLATWRTWSYKKLLSDLWAHEKEGKAKSDFRDWYQRVIRTKILPMKKLVRVLRERIKNIMTYCTHVIINALAEGINSNIMLIRRRAGGYRNVENLKTAVLISCGGLDLDPR
jgi:transposase